VGKRSALAVTVAWGLALGATGNPTPAGAHGFAGKRFFPATLAVDDPFVADELSFPAVSYTTTPATAEEPRSHDTSVRGELSKRVTPDFGFSVGGGVAHLDPDDKPTLTGFTNLDVGLKYQLFVNDAHETIVAGGVTWEVGGTGRAATGAESFDTVTPAVFIGKGFGDLPDALPFLKPLALTGTLAGSIPTERNPDRLEWGLVAEYSLPYLQSFVQDVGLPAPLNRIIAVVELSGQTPLERSGNGGATGTVNPGIIWIGRFFQLGLEAIVPLNGRTSKTVGVRGQLHFFLDDLFPNSLGHVLFGG
jgi:hypothetical protein